MMMLIVAMTAMIGSIYLFCTTDRDRDHDELRDKELIYDKRSEDALLFRDFTFYSLVNLEKNNEKSEFYGKIAILAFTVIGTVTFLILQIAWYRKFFEKLRRVNREIEVEIGENIKKKTLSTICKSFTRYPQLTGLALYNSFDFVISYLDVKEFIKAVA